MIPIDQIVNILISFTSLLFAIFLLTAKTKNYLSNVLIALFLIVNAQDFGGIFASSFIYPKYPGWGMIVNHTVFFQMPLIYLYLLSVIYSDFKLKKKHLLHLLPFFLNAIILIPRYYRIDFDAKWELLSTGEIDGLLEIKISYILLHLQILVYVIASFNLISRYKSILLENYSNAILFNYNWLFQLILFLAISSFIASIKNLSMFLEIELAFYYTELLISILTLGFICWIVIKALNNPELFRGVNSNLQLVKNLIKEDVQNGVLLNNSVKTDEIIKLKKFMTEEEPYLDDSLTINDLSKKMNISVRELSLLINHTLNQHFYDFINNYRIRKAMFLLKNKKELTIQEIFFEVGFNSKSSFYTAFKKQTNLTPTQFRKKPTL